MIVKNVPFTTEVLMQYRLDDYTLEIFDLHFHITLLFYLKIMPTS